MYHDIFVSAEIGCNHKGDLRIAHDLIKIAAKTCKVSAIKFQKRTPKELLSPTEYNAPHPNLMNSYGNTYGEHREKLEFTLEQHSQLKLWCEEENVIYYTSVWDMTSTKEIVSIDPKIIKIPSACNSNMQILEYLIKNYPYEIHISLGMTTHKEEDQIVDLFIKNNRAKDLVVYSCTSGYPVPFHDICLYEITRIKSKLGPHVKGIGFSGHHLGISVDIAALTLGATYIERHFTLDRTWKGTDHAASLEPDGMRRLVRDLNNVNQSLSYKKQEILDIEQIQRDKLKRSW